MPTTHDYFYTPPSHVGPHSLELDGEELQHVVHVMRKNIGDTIVVVDGKGNIYETIIRRVTRTSAECEIKAHRNGENENRTNIILGVGILKNHARFDFIVEKATELGVGKIVPLRSSRTIPQHGKEERLRKLALAAMKQSGRCMLPAVSPLTRLEDYVRSIGPEALSLIPYEREGVPMIHKLLGATARLTIALCIGPEGGWTSEEIQIGASSGFLPVSLGPRILRTETAAIVATALCALTESLAQERP